MKAKRRLLALLLSAVIFWQGFSVVNAEDYSGSDGSFTFLVQIDRSVVQTKQRVPIHITINGAERMATYL